MTITALYASLLAFMFVALSVRVIVMRRSAGVGLGDGGNRILLRRLRAHGNFAEYVPFALVLMMLAELQGAAGWIVNGLGLVLLAGRLVHAYGVSREPEPAMTRVVGMALTFSALLAGALCTLVLSLSSSL